MNPSKYDIVRQIGEGQYGQIYLATLSNDTSQQLFAIKEIDSKQNDSELLLLPFIHHPNIIHVYQILTNQDSKSIVLQYATQGDLAVFVKKNYAKKEIPESLIKSWLLQLSLALYHLHHQLNIIHRDIKTMNVLVTENGLIKLADFGLAKKMSNEDDFAKSTVGTPYYLSPEAVIHSKSNNKSDMWGLGCLLYQLCTGEKPFKGSAFGQIFESITKGTVGEIPQRYSKWLSTLIKKLLQKNAEKRPSVQSILQDEQMRRQFSKLKAVYKQYEGFSYPQLNLRTTKYLDRQQRYSGSIKMFSQSLKTAKKQKPIKLQMEEGFGEVPKNKQKKVQRTKFVHKSLRSLLQKSKQQKE